VLLVFLFLHVFDVPPILSLSTIPDKSLALWYTFSVLAVSLGSHREEISVDAHVGNFCQVSPFFLRSFEDEFALLCILQVF